MCFIFLIINNNQKLKDMRDDYMKQQEKFTKYYKNNFLTFYYVLPPIGILSGLGMFYTGYLLNNLYQEVLLEKVHFLSHQQEIQSLQQLFTVFVIIFFLYVILDVGIAIYVIHNKNSRIEPNWRSWMIVAKILGRTTVVGSGVAAAGTVVAGAPEPSPASNYIHTRTWVGRGWDSEPGDVFTKKDVMKLQQFTGNQLLLEKLNQLNSGENKVIVTRDTYQKLLEDPEIRNKILKATNITDEELYSMGLKTLPELAGSTAKKSAKLGWFSSFGEKIDSKLESLGDMFRSGVNKLKQLSPWGSESVPKQGDNDLFSQNKEPDMSDEEFEEKQNSEDVEENTPGKRAKKN